MNAEKGMVRDCCGAKRVEANVNKTIRSFEAIVRQNGEVTTCTFSVRFGCQGHAKIMKQRMVYLEGFASKSLSAADVRTPLMQLGVALIFSLAVIIDKFCSSQQFSQDFSYRRLSAPGKKIHLFVIDFGRFCSEVEWWKPDPVRALRW